MWYRITAILIALLWHQQVLAHAWVANAPVWSRSYAEAQVPGDGEITDSGVTFGHTTATATAANANANAFAHAHSVGLWGGNVKTTANGQGAWAGTANPFDAPIVPGIGPGSAEMDYSATYSGSQFYLSGTSSHNSNGYLELAVLNIDGLTENFVSEIFLTYGSVESALTAGYITSDRVLFERRETTLGSSFSYTVDIGSLEHSDILVSGVSHSVAAVPEPSLLSMMGLGGIAVALAARRRGQRGKA